MGIPYETAPQGKLEAVPGKLNVFPLSFPNKTAITKILIVQTSGTVTSFTAALYNNESAAGGRPESESLNPDVVIFPTDLYRVTPDLAGANGKLLYFSEAENSGMGFPFFSQDDPERSQSIMGGSRRVYLQIVTPVAMTFSVVLGGDTYI